MGLTKFPNPVQKVSRQMEIGIMAQQNEWSGYPHPDAPDHFWIDDATGEVVCASTGIRLAPGTPISDEEAFAHWSPEFFASCGKEL